MMKINGRTGPYKVNGKALSTLLKCNDLDLYKLKTDFSQVSGQPVTLTNAQVLDTVGEGAVTGTLTVVDAGVGTGVVSVTGNNLSIKGQTTPNAAWNVVGIASATAMPRTNGRIFKAVFTLTGTGSDDSCVIGLGGTSGSLTLVNRKHTFVFGGSLALYCAVGNGSPDYAQGTYLAATEYSVAIVLMASGAYYFIKGGAYPIWTLLVVDYTDTTANLYAHAQSRFGSREIITSHIKITDTLYPNLVQTVAEDDFTSADGTDLSTRTAAKGGTWSKTIRAGSGIVEINSNKTRAQTSGAQIVSLLDAGISDALVTAMWGAGQANEYSLVTIVSRADMAAADYNNSVNVAFCNTLIGTYNNQIRIAEYTSGVSALRGSVAATYADNTNYEVSARIVGASFTAMSSAASLTVTLASPTTNTKFGFESFYLGTVTNRDTIDNFKVYPFVDLYNWDTVLDSI